MATTLGEARAYARVTGTRRSAFIEFQFLLDDGDLAVELIMPFKAFEEFCATNGVTVLPPEDADARADFDRLQWRSGAPGLYRKPNPEQSE